MTWYSIIATITVVGTVLIVQWLNHQKVKWIEVLLNWLPAILFAYIIPALVTHVTGWDLSKVYLHSISREWLIPLAIILVMSALSFRQLKIVGLKPIILFVAGSFVIAILPFVITFSLGHLDSSAKALLIDEEYWRGFIPIVGGWIGGSTSQLVLKEIANCPESLFLSVIVLDNILVNIWTILMFQAIKRSEVLNKLLNINNEIKSNKIDFDHGRESTRQSTIINASVIILLVIVVNFLTTNFLLRVIALSILGLLLGNLLPRWNHFLVLKVGGWLIILIMAILGLRLDFAGVSLPMTFVTVCVIWLVGHYIFMMIIAWLLKLHMAWVPIASMANLGGISTAPAVTSAYNKDWMPHAIFLAILSMVSGNAWGLFTIYLFNRL